MRGLLLFCLLFVFVSSVFASNPPLPSAQGLHSEHLDGSPLLPNSINTAGIFSTTEANPVHTPTPPPAVPKPPASYLPGVDFLGSSTGVPLNPTEHLKANLEEDRKYIAAILRTPVDLGDPTDCKHSDIIRDEIELKKDCFKNKSSPYCFTTTTTLD